MKPCGFDIGREQPFTLIAGPMAVPLKHTKTLLETLRGPDRATPKNAFPEHSFH